MKKALAIVVAVLGALVASPVYAYQPVPSVAPIGGLSHLYVAADVRPKTLIVLQVEYRLKRPMWSAAAQARATELNRLLREQYRLVGAQDKGHTVHMLCDITLRDWDVGEPDFHIICGTSIPWILTEPSVAREENIDTPAGVLRFIESFRAMHERRIRQPRN